MTLPLLLRPFVFFSFCLRFIGAHLLLPSKEVECIYAYRYGWMAYRTVMCDSGTHPIHTKYPPLVLQDFNLRPR